ncbi:flagellar basal-body rod protein FlgG [Verminephrobacter eiseniae]|uniref:flagellar basal-body rod protein FlgG n=1 Tax=Verminephrobacter eiseniae TaxID=364317 RepID=UPI002237ADF7|nr:flagellar basal-body rod protein FlgG [Verminephrobacter eiseniae]MCW5235149.1 flagellar basal-body rod protein FlgG [Verminephrobacter eiseniae]MCW5261541.1 flagellar basal-body rod protein FlgG [Verminephrobacter eiseniae]
MIDALWIAKTGMSAQQTQLDVIAHNLANVSTTGYKRSNAMFEDLIYQNLRQVGANSTEQNQLPTGLQLGLGVRTVATSRCFVQGSLQESRNNLDVAINGNGFFQVTLPDGSLGYTRDGSFQVDAQGRLVTANGLPVANGITIAANAISVSISAEGAVSAIMPGSVQPQPLGNLAMASFINPAGLEPIGQNLFKESAASGQPQQGIPGSNGLGVIKQGFLEASNINIVEELVTMIQTQRAYEMNSKAIQTSDQMLAKLSQL